MIVRYDFDLEDAVTRLTEEIEGERRAWAHVEVRPDDLARVLAAIKPCPWCGHPPTCHTGPESACVPAVQP